MRIQVMGGAMAKRWMLSSGLFLILLALFIFEFPRFFAFFLGGITMFFGILIFIGGIVAPKRPNSGSPMAGQGNQTEDGTWEDLS
jgi:hypothetical protein